MSDLLEIGDELVDTQQPESNLGRETNTVTSTVQVLTFEKSPIRFSLIILAVFFNIDIKSTSVGNFPKSNTS
jgi:hypothetical protein